jgi:D-proline reductase (dithiol) PrdB
VSSPGSDRHAAADADAPIRYIERTRAYYEALGYPRPYRWASHASTPFAAPRRPLAGSTVALITTAAPVRPGAADQGRRAPYDGAAKFHRVYSVAAEPAPDLRISHVAYDRYHARPEDPETYLPLCALRAAVSEGRVGALALRVHGLPSSRSQSTTLDLHAPELLRRLREDAADFALLVPS